MYVRPWMWCVTKCFVDCRKGSVWEPPRPPMEGTVDRRLSEMLLQKSTASLALSSESLARAQHQSEAVIAAECLHQRALEGNGGIKMGTAGTYTRAGCFCFFSSPGHCSICAPPAPLGASRQTHGRQAPPSSLIGSCHGDAGSRR